MEKGLINATAEEPTPEINFDAFIIALQKQKPEAGKLTLDKEMKLRIFDLKGNEIQVFDFATFAGVEEFFGMANEVMKSEE